jgi:hypothetical protein
VHLGDPLYAFGYMDEVPHGDSATLEYEGPSLRPDELHKLKGGQVRPGLSGAPLLNRHTGWVCGVLKRTRDRASDLGGQAIPAAAVFDAFPELRDRRRHVDADMAWLVCLSLEQRRRLAAQSMPLTNPFYGDSTELIGRDDALQRAFEKLRAGNHCSVVGPPGSGKTSLLKVIRERVPDALGLRPEHVGWISFRSINALRDLQEAIVIELGGQRANGWRGLLQAKGLRLLVLDDLGGMDPGARGLTMRRWLRGLDDNFGIKLLMASNERLDVLFRKDDPTRDSPLDGLDPLPVELAPLSKRDRERLVALRLAGSPFRVEDFRDFCAEPVQPGPLLHHCCVARFEALLRDWMGLTR